MANMMISLRWDGPRLSQEQLTKRAALAAEVVELAYPSVDHLDVKALPDEVGQFVQLIVETSATEQQRHSMRETFQREFLAAEPASNRRQATQDKNFRDAEQKIEQASRDNAKTLYLSAMELTELPESLGQLRNLQKLYLYNNQLSAVPESLGQLLKLQTLDLDNNQLPHAMREAYARGTTSDFLAYLRELGSAKGR